MKYAMGNGLKKSHISATSELGTREFSILNGSFLLDVSNAFIVTNSLSMTYCVDRRRLIQVRFI